MRRGSPRTPVPLGRRLRSPAAERAIEEPVFYFAYGLLKIAVIVQQIYFRYQKGLTRDPRFARLGGLVKACGELAQRAIERRRIDALG